MLLPDAPLLSAPLRTLRETQPWPSPQVSDRYLSAHYSTVGQVSPRTRKSMSLDMGQPSQANAKKLLGTGLPPRRRRGAAGACWVIGFVVSRHQEELRPPHIRLQSTKETGDGVRDDHASQDAPRGRERLRDR